MLRRAALALSLLVSSCQPAPASTIPSNAIKYLPLLVSIQRSSWTDAPMASFLAGQIEQESCVSLKSTRCWNPNVELKTSREWGRGLGQITTAYNSDGSVKFDKQAELRAQYSSLKDWTIDRWADPHYQLMAIIEMDHGIYRRIQDAATNDDHIAMVLAAYNGGEGGLRQDRLLCRNTNGCNPSRWFGNVEMNSLKSRIPYKGYGQSPFKINRDYPTNILYLRRQKYESFFEK